jgi:ABC-type spermidine/putrescine transport system permease subunit I
MRVQRFEAPIMVTPAVVFLAVFFVVPLARLFSLAFTGDAATSQPFAELIGSEVYRRVLFRTLWVCSLVTGVTLVLAFPLATLLCRLSGARFLLALYGVLLPLWISVLVRTFSWMLLLERNGPINRGFHELGLIDRPLSLLFNDIGVVIGMVHVLLPYAVLPLYAAMSRIDPRLLLASDGLGATPFATFARIYLPLSMPGIIAAVGLVFLVSLGFFVTPALLGGANAMTVSMLIASFVSDRLAWALAAAASLVLLAAVLGLLWLLSRFIPLRQGIVLR